MGPLLLSDHMVQNCQTREQMMHWDVLSKTTKLKFSLFNIVYHFSIFAFSFLIFI